MHDDGLYTRTSVRINKHFPRKKAGKNLDKFSFHSQWWWWGHYYIIIYGPHIVPAHNIELVKFEFSCFISWFFENLNWILKLCRWLYERIWLNYMVAIVLVVAGLWMGGNVFHLHFDIFILFHLGVIFFLVAEPMNKSSIDATIDSVSCPHTTTQTQTATLKLFDHQRCCCCLFVCYNQR